MGIPLVIIPTYNEKDNIVPLITELLSTAPDLEILIVDDNSPDGTGELALAMSRQENRVHLLQRPSKMGLGSAYLDAFGKALAMENVSLICTMDADFSHDPHQLPGLLQAARDSDVVVGSRYLEGINVVNWPLHRIILSYSANAYARLITGLPIRDCTSGFCCLRREVLQTIRLDSIKSEGYAFLIELKHRAWTHGFTLSEVPIIFHERRYGSSKISKRIILEAALLVWKLRLGL